MSGDNGNQQITISAEILMKLATKEDLTKIENSINNFISKFDVMAKQVTDHGYYIQNRPSDVCVEFTEAIIIKKNEELHNKLIDEHKQFHAKEKELDKRKIKKGFQYWVSILGGLIGLLSGTIVLFYEKIKLIF